MVKTNCKKCAARGKTAWDIAAVYTVFFDDMKALNMVMPDILPEGDGPR